MRRILIGVLALAGCEPGGAAIQVPEPEATTAEGEGWFDEPWETPGTVGTEPDWSAYDDATVEIVSPQPGETVPWGESYPYEAVVTNPAGDVLSVDAVTWTARDDLDFHGEALAFDDDGLGVGMHEVSVVVDLPSGDRLGHTVGGVRVQSPWAGTYAGLFKVDGTVNNITIACTGSGTVVFGPLGQLGTGGADCVVSLLAISIPMTWNLELENTDGVITGTGGVELVGIFTWDLPADGVIDPITQTADVSFEGPIPFIGSLSASFEAPRISLDSGLE
jgi:hypothetical protein